MRGRFITVEGSEGVGKSSNLEFIYQYLKQAGKKVVLTREPGGTPVAETIRELLLDARQSSITDDAELLLMFAARAQHLSEVIIPALQRGDWVLCDRFTDATYAYQGGGRGINQQRIAILENWVQGELRPDHTILLDMPVEAGLERAGKRSQPDRFEQEQISFFHKVRQAYLARAEEDKARFFVINAAPALEVVQHQITSVLDLVLKR